MSYKKIGKWFFKNIGRADIFVVIFALILMHNLHWVIEFFYPITGEPSMVWIYNTVFGLTRGSIIIGYAYLMFRIFFPKLYYYLENNFNEEYNQLKWQKLNITLLVYAFFLVFFLVSVVTM